LAAVQRLAHQLTPAVNPTYTARRPDAKPPRLARSSDGRRHAAGVGPKLRVASCMRLLDQTRQQRPNPLLWRKGRPSARSPWRPAANPCDRSNSGLFALEGNPHQRCLARTMRSREAEGLGDRRPADDGTREPRAHGCLRRRHPAAPAAADSRSEVLRHLRATAAAMQRAPPAPANRNASPDQQRAARGLREPNSHPATSLLPDPEKCFGSV